MTRPPREREIVLQVVGSRDGALQVGVGVVDLVEVALVEVALVEVVLVEVVLVEEDVVVECPGVEIELTDTTGEPAGVDVVLIEDDVLLDDEVVLMEEEVVLLDDDDFAEDVVLIEEEVALLEDEVEVDEDLTVVVVWIGVADEVLLLLIVDDKVTLVVEQ